jgi:hypothetical protein
MTEDRATHKDGAADAANDADWARLVAALAEDRPVPAGLGLPAAEIAWAQRVFAAAAEPARAAGRDLWPRVRDEVLAGMVLTAATGAADDVDDDSPVEPALSRLESALAAGEPAPTRDLWTAVRNDAAADLAASRALAGDTGDAAAAGIASALRTIESALPQLAPTRDLWPEIAAGARRAAAAAEPSSRRSASGSRPRLLLAMPVAMSIAAMLLIALGFTALIPPTQPAGTDDVADTEPDPPAEPPAVFYRHELGVIVAAGDPAAGDLTRLRTLHSLQKPGPATGDDTGDADERFWEPDAFIVSRCDSAIITDWADVAAAGAVGRTVLDTGQRRNTVGLDPIGGQTITVIRRGADDEVAVDLDGDGLGDVRVGPNGERFLLHIAAEPGAGVAAVPYAFDLVFHPDAGRWRLQPSLAVVTREQIGGGRVAFIDSDVNGRFDDHGRDQMVVVGAPIAVRLAELTRLRSELYSVYVSADGRRAGFFRYDGPRGRLLVDGDYRPGVRIEYLHLRSQDAEIVLGGRAINESEVGLPPGRFTLVRGRVGDGTRSFRIDTIAGMHDTGAERDHSDTGARVGLVTVEVSQDGVAQLFLGGPLRVDAALSRLDNGNQALFGYAVERMLLTGASGEAYLPDDGKSAQAMRNVRATAVAESYVMGVGVLGRAGDRDAIFFPYLDRTPGGRMSAVFTEQDAAAFLYGEPASGSVELP